MHDPSQSGTTKINPDNSKLYDEFFGGVVDYYAQAHIIAEKLEARRARTIVEFGCATGTLLIPLAVHGFTCTGIDKDARFLEEATRKAAFNLVALNLFCQDILHPSVTGPFDCVICLRVPLSPADTQGVVQSAARLLSPGGVLIMEFPVFNGNAERFLNGSAPNPSTFLSTWVSDGRPAAKVSHFHVMADHVSVSGFYMVGMHGTVDLSTYWFEMWPLSEHRIKQTLEQAGLSWEDTAFVERDTVPGVDGMAIMACRR